MLAIEGQHYYTLLWPASLSATGLPAQVTTGTVCGKVTGKVHTCHYKGCSPVKKCKFPFTEGNFGNWNSYDVTKVKVQNTTRVLLSLIPNTLEQIQQSAEEEGSEWQLCSGDLKVRKKSITTFIFKQDHLTQR